MSYRGGLCTRVSGVTSVDTFVFDQDTGTAQKNLQALVDITTLKDPIESTDLRELSQNHEDVFEPILTNFSQKFESIMTAADADYRDLKTALQNAITKVQEVSSDSNVPVGSLTSITPSTVAGGGGDVDSGNSIVPFVPVDKKDPVIDAVTGTNIATDTNVNTGMNTNVNTDANVSTNVNSNMNTDSNVNTATNTDVNAISNEGAGAGNGSNTDLNTAATAGVIGTALNPGNAFGDTAVGQETWSKFTPEEQDAIRSKLQGMGYTDDEINQIMSGSVSAPKLVVNELTSALESNYSPELRNELIGRYGFDVFNEDGTVDKEKLALALVMDNKEGTDEYSMIEMLHSKGIDIVNQTMYDNVADRLNDLIVQYPDLRDKLLEKYGFDIFNTDGTINRDKLTLALLMDMEDTADDFDLLAYLTETYGEEAAKTLLSNVKPVYSKKSSRGTGVVMTAAGVGLLGATAGGLAFLAKKKKDAEDDELKYLEDEELSEGSSHDGVESETSREEEQESDKEWLYGLGLGLAAKRTDLSDEDDISTGAAKNSQDIVSG